MQIDIYLKAKTKDDLLENIEKGWIKWKQCFRQLSQKEYGPDERRIGDAFLKKIYN